MSAFLLGNYEFGIKLKNSHLSENSKRVASAKLIIHNRWASKFYGKTKEITQKCQENDSTIMGFSFDYMQNFPLPVFAVQEVFNFGQL